MPTQDELARKVSAFEKYLDDYGIFHFRNVDNGDLKRFILHQYTPQMNIFLIS